MNNCVCSIHNSIWIGISTVYLEILNVVSDQALKSLNISRGNVYHVWENVNVIILLQNFIRNLRLNKMYCLKKSLIYLCIGEMTNNM